MGRTAELMSLPISERRTANGRYFIKSRIPGPTRIEVALRYGCPQGTFGDAWCVYCNAPGRVAWEIGWRGTATQRVTFPGLELDHVIPEFKGGSNEPENIVLACRKCNRGRGWMGKYQPEIKFPAPRKESA